MTSELTGLRNQLQQFVALNQHGAVAKGTSLFDKRLVACSSPQANFDTHPPPRTNAQILTKHHADTSTEIAHMQEVAQLQPSVSTLDQITRYGPMIYDGTAEKHVNVIVV